MNQLYQQDEKKIVWRQDVWNKIKGFFTWLGGLSFIAALVALFCGTHGRGMADSKRDASELKENNERERQLAERQGDLNKEQRDNTERQREIVERQREALDKERELGERERQLNQEQHRAVDRLGQIIEQVEKREHPHGI